MRLAIVVASWSTDYSGRGAWSCDWDDTAGTVALTVTSGPADGSTTDGSDDSLEELVLTALSAHPNSRNASGRLVLLRLPVSPH